MRGSVPTGSAWAPVLLPTSRKLLSTSAPSESPPWGKMSGEQASLGLAGRMPSSQQALDQLSTLGSHSDEPCPTTAHPTGRRAPSSLPGLENYPEWFPIGSCPSTSLLLIPGSALPTCGLDGCFLAARFINLMG